MHYNNIKVTTGLAINIVKSDVNIKSFIPKKTLNVNIFPQEITICKIRIELEPFNKLGHSTIANRQQFTKTLYNFLQIALSYLIRKAYKLVLPKIVQNWNSLIKTGEWSGKLKHHWQYEVESCNFTGSMVWKVVISLAVWGGNSSKSLAHGSMAWPCHQLVSLKTLEQKYSTLFLVESRRLQVLVPEIRNNALYIYKATKSYHYHVRTCKLFSAPGQQLSVQSNGLHTYKCEIDKMSIHLWVF